MRKLIERKKGERSAFSHGVLVFYSHAGGGEDGMGVVVDFAE